MSQASSVSGEVFRNDQLFSVLAQNPSTAKYLGQPDVCRIISELRSDPSVYAAKYSKDPRIVEIATQLSTVNTRPSWPPSWSSYSRSNTSTEQYSGGSTDASWRSARRTAPRSTPSNDISSFFRAVRTGDLTSVSSEVDRNEMALFQEDDFGYTALHLAAQNGHAHIVTYLLSKGVDVDLKQAAGYTPLHMAVLSDKTNVALALIDNGANVNAKDNEGNTALEYALRNDNPELISVLIEAATGDPVLQVQRQQKKQQNERRRQTSSLALPAQVERKLVRGTRRTSSSTSTSTRPAPSLFDDCDDDGLFGDSSFTPTQVAEKEAIEEEEEDGSLGSLFGNENEDEEDFDYTPKAKEAKPKSKEQKPSKETEKEVEWESVSSFFGADEDDEVPLLFKTETTPSAPASSITSTSVTAQTTVRVATPTSTAVVTTSSVSVMQGGSDEVTQLLQQIQQLQDQLAEKDRQLLAKDDKISILEEDTWCRICMDKKIETVLLWCGHNILCLDCSQRVQKAKKECPVCSKAVTRVVRTYRA